MKLETNYKKTKIYKNTQNIGDYTTWTTNGSKKKTKRNKTYLETNDRNITYQNIRCCKSSSNREVNSNKCLKKKQERSQINKLYTSRILKKYKLSKRE